MLAKALLPASEGDVENTVSVAGLLPTPRAPVDHGRTRWLDGVRCAAAVFVVVHHCYLAVYPTFPRNTGPSYVGWMLYGHLAVVVFIVVSGYSLTLAPARNGFRLKGGAATFARRRAWRILPPYWAALALSMPVFILITNPHLSGRVIVKAFFVHALLLQDIIGSPTPNGAFWSIAVEAQIYVLFPILLYVRRKRGPVFTAAVATIVTCILEVLAHKVPALARYDNLTPQLFADFALGMAAASSMEAVRIRGRRVPMLGLSGLLCAAGVVAMNRLGSQRVVANFFSVDIAVGLITAVAFRGIASSTGGRVKSVFQSRLLVAGGTFSYSVYLVHSVILALVSKYLAEPLHLNGVPHLAILLALVVPIAIATSYGFFLVFEKPFLNARSIDAIRPTLQRLGIRRTPRDDDPVAEASAREPSQR